MHYTWWELFPPYSHLSTMQCSEHCACHFLSQFVTFVLDRNTLLSILHCQWRTTEEEIAKTIGQESLQKLIFFFCLVSQTRLWVTSRYLHKTNKQIKIVVHTYVPNQFIYGQILSWLKIYHLIEPLCSCLLPRIEELCKVDRVVPGWLS